MLAAVDDVIDAVARLWPLILSGAVLLAIILFRRQVRNLIDRIRRTEYRSRRGTTFSVETEPVAAHAPAAQASEPKPPPESPEDQLTAKAEAETETDGGLPLLLQAFYERRFSDAEQIFERMRAAEETPAEQESDEVGQSLRHLVP